MDVLEEVETSSWAWSCHKTAYRAQMATIMVGFYEVWLAFDPLHEFDGPDSTTPPGMFPFNDDQTVPVVLGNG